MGYAGRIYPACSKNSKSVIDNPEAALSKINEEIKLGRIAGPFKIPPLKNFVVSPLALRAKKNSQKIRLLHNLSAPYDGSSINFNIPDEAAKVTYANITNALEIILNKKCCFLAKTDIADAFRLIPLAKQDHHLMGFKIKDNFYYDMCLPMGCRSSCAIFERFSDALLYILKTKYKVTNVVKVLDDFLFLGSTRAECEKGLTAFREIAKIINLPIAEHKTLGPTRVLTFLGIEIDTVLQQVRIPEDKLQENLLLIAKAVKDPNLTLRELKSLIGKLGFASNVISAGKTFLRRLHDCTVGAYDPNRIVYLHDETLNDLKAWQHFLRSYNGKTFYWAIPALSPPSVSLYSDSSGYGYGGVCYPYWFCGRFPEVWGEFDIQYLELYPILLHFHVFEKIVRGKHVLVLTDNQAIAYTLNNLSSKNKNVMTLMRILVIQLMKINSYITAVHLPGKLNKVCDFISRHQVTEEFTTRYGLQARPSPVPVSLRPHNLRLNSL